MFGRDKCFDPGGALYYIQASPISKPRASRQRVSCQIFGILSSPHSGQWLFPTPFAKYLAGLTPSGPSWIDTLLGFGGLLHSKQLGLADEEQRAISGTCDHKSITRSPGTEVVLLVLALECKGLTVAAIAQLESQTA